MINVKSNSSKTEENVKQPDQNKPTLLQNIKGVALNITIEPVMVLYILPSVLSGLAMQNLNLEKACRVNLQLQSKTCDALTSRNTSIYSKEDEIEVQKLVASMLSWKSFLQSCIPAMLLLFFGSWSDRHRRRKYFILVPIFGEALSCVGFLLSTYFFYELPMEWNGISEALPQALTGGWFTMFMAAFSYIADISSVEDRTSKIGVVHILIEISVTLGIALSGILLNVIHYSGVFFLCLALYATSIAFGCFRIKENGYKHTSNGSKNVEAASDKRLSKVEFLKDFFNLKHIKETFLVVFKSKQNNRKTRVCLIFVLVIVISGPLFGEMGVLYLYVRHRFHWNEIDYSVYSTYKMLLHLFGTTFSLTLFSKFLKLDDSLLGLISTSSRVLSCFVYAFAPTGTIFYLGTVVELVGGTSHIAMRSIITKLVVPGELGKVNSLFGVCEALVPLLYGPMYSMLYKSTITVLPGAFLLVGGLCTFPATLIFLWLYFQHKQDKKEAKQNQVLNEELLDQRNVPQVSV